MAKFNTKTSKLFNLGKSLRPSPRVLSPQLPYRSWKEWCVCLMQKPDRLVPNRPLFPVCLFVCLCTVATRAWQPVIEREETQKKADFTHSNWEWFCLGGKCFYTPSEATEMIVSIRHKLMGGPGMIHAHFQKLKRIVHFGNIT